MITILGAPQTTGTSPTQVNQVQIPNQSSGVHDGNMPNIQVNDVQRATTSGTQHQYPMAATQSLSVAAGTSDGNMHVQVPSSALRGAGTRNLPRRACKGKKPYSPVSPSVSELMESFGEYNISNIRIQYI